MIILQKMNQFMGTQYTAHLVMLTANTLWSIGLMNGAETKYASTFYIGLVRGIISVAASYILCRVYGHKTDFSNKRDLKIAIIRSIITGMQQLVTSFGFYHLQPSLVYTITNIGPIIVFIMDYYKNKTAITKRQIFGVIISTFGLLIAVNSLVIMHWLGYESFAQKSKYHYHDSSLYFKIIVCLLLFVEYIFWAYAMIITKDLRHTNPFQLNFLTGVVLTILSSAFYIMMPNSRAISAFQMSYDFIFIGGVLSLSTVFYMLGLTLSKNTGSLTITNFFTVIFGYIISIVRYGQTPNIIGIMGSVFIFVGLFLVLIKNREQASDQGK